MREKRQLKNLVLMALNTGMRRQEMFNLRWEDVISENRLLRVPESKNEKSRHIPKNTAVEERLKGLPSRFQKGLVFPSPLTGGKLTDFLENI